MIQTRTVRRANDATIYSPPQHAFLMIWAMTIVLLGVSACGQAMAVDVGAVAAPSPVTTATSQAQNSVQGSVVEVTPMPDAELATQPTGESQPGAAATSEGSQAEPGVSNAQPQPGSTVVYADSTHLFEVAYPKDFVFRTQPVEKLVQLTPRPDASYIFMNPVAAASDAPELEPADLELRVYVVTEQPESLETWLTSNGLLPADGSVRPRPFQKGELTGVEVCASTMIAPGCSYFVLGNGRVYQSIPATLAGEAMIETVKLTS